ncbi:30S ribosomal protein S1 [Bythopirellula goksoeyrii]|uniref:30S ribosomal protein S1 n=1 Tax=Bythopirellula goksoeyrii TaxID=1400387 RepID=A0A5B9Q4F0_9BACT|nr:S1 RNA-binding domain-containing protein [Bythopirellula goksoeyrii]QEG33898.1 30S ribosomal protein S1 [Bythopirellula goksoeyrii]
MTTPTDSTDSTRALPESNHASDNGVDATQGNESSIEAAESVQEQSASESVAQPLPTQEPTASVSQSPQPTDIDTGPAVEPPAEQAQSSDPEQARPSERIQIGTQRATSGEEAPKAKPMNPGTATEAAPKKSNYPPPNIRDALTPELEAELAAALGGESLDNLIEGSATAVTGAELPVDTKITGKVTSIHRDDIFVDLGGRNQGLLPLKQFEKTAPPEIGTQVEVVVTRFDAEQGLYDVSLPTAAVQVGNWEDVAEGQVVDVTITGANKGGLECMLAGIRGFIPMGQISIYRIENAEEYVGQKLTCVITEANRGRGNLVLSHRALMERERKEQKEKLLAEISAGDLREGVVRSLQDFGAFVDLGGVDGLIHVSQLSWDRVSHPKDVLAVGQNVKVRVEKINAESGKISLGYRELGDNPWDSAEQKFPVGARVKGSVTKLMQFGAFVRLDPGVEGLIHISEMGHGRVNRSSDVVSEGQEVEVKVVSFDRDAQRIGLSLKALLPPPEKAPQESRESEHPAPESVKRREKESDKNLKGGIGGPSGGEKFGLRW